MTDKPKRIVYVVPFYYGYGISYYPFFPDIVLIDWQLRLFSFLSDLGYQVITKQHPESPTMMDKFFFEEIGAIDIKGNFEDVIPEEDVVLFDFPLSTAFGSALRRGNPITLINFGFQQLMPEEERILKKRIEILPGSFNENKIPDVDWNQLEKSISACYGLKDSRYTKEVLGEK
jgi:hypothetical protein|tara:strand:+ start:1219 stop:1740 length:522 start_codon:yes stop_codon:yes gene_type:complete